MGSMEFDFESTARALTPTDLAGQLSWDLWW